MSADLAGLAERLAGGSLGSPFVHYARTSSTNDRAKEAAREGAPHGALFVADAQDAGRGRQGRAWLSSPGENLLASVLLRSPLLAAQPARRPQIPLAVGLALRGALAALLPGHDVRVKWPNDVIVLQDGGPRKLAGILVEAVGDALIVGFGVNVRTLEFPEEIRALATSVALLRGDASLGRGDVLAAALPAIAHECDRVLAQGFAAIRPRYLAAWCLDGAAVTVATDSGDTPAVVRGVADDGRLVVETAAGTVLVAAGDIHLGTR